MSDAGDVRVFGLVAGTHVIEDIGMDVPHGCEVIIPAEKAARSRDLYKAISQKNIYRLPNAPVPKHGTPTTVIRDDILQQRCQFLERENDQLKTEVSQLRASLVSAMGQEGRLDAILTAIQGVKLPETVYVRGENDGQRSTKPAEELADGSAPQYIPSEIAPKDAETRIGVKRTTTETDSELSGAADKLRKMRRGSTEGG